MTFLEWFLMVFLGVIYLTCIFTVAGITFRRVTGFWASWGSSSPSSG